jgi:hypothetical protein
MGGLPTLREAELALRCARVDEDGNITISDVVAQRIRLELELLRATTAGHKARVADAIEHAMAEHSGVLHRLGES